jgi:hypothetical protein
MTNGERLIGPALREQVSFMAPAPNKKGHIRVFFEGLRPGIFVLGQFVLGGSGAETLNPPE